MENFLSNNDILYLKGFLYQQNKHFKEKWKRYFKLLTLIRCISYFIKEQQQQQKSTTETMKWQLFQ